MPLVPLNALKKVQLSDVARHPLLRFATLPSLEREFWRTVFSMDGLMLCAMATLPGPATSMLPRAQQRPQSVLRRMTIPMHCFGDNTMAIALVHTTHVLHANNDGIMGTSMLQNQHRSRTASAYAESTDDDS